MTDAWTQRWNERYKEDTYAYGEHPNQYLKEKLAPLTPGRILFPAEGEGRNAVYAATLGWTVAAFDISSEGKNKAMKLATAKGVQIDYRVGALPALDFQPEQFDAIALIYAHFPIAIKSDYHKQLNKLLRKGGVIIFEAFSKKHLDYVTRNEKVGGPKNIADLFSIEDIRADFPGYDYVELAETEIELHEGVYHNGVGSVIRFLAVKQ